MDSRYALGITELDAQHSEIESLFIALQEALEHKKSGHALLADLCEKLRFHFHAEESVMQIFAYPETQEHKRKHLEILKSVESYKDKRLTKADIQELKDQPMQLFYDQILSQDMRFAVFIKNNKERMGIT